MAGTLLVVIVIAIMVTAIQEIRREQRRLEPDSPSVTSESVVRATAYYLVIFGGVLAGRFIASHALGALGVVTGARSDLFVGSAGILCVAAGSFLRRRQPFGHAFCAMTVLLATAFYLLEPALRGRVRSFEPAWWRCVLPASLAGVVCLFIGRRVVRDRLAMRGA